MSKRSNTTVCVKLGQIGGCSNARAKMDTSGSVRDDEIYFDWRRRSFGLVYFLFTDVCSPYSLMHSPTARRTNPPQSVCTGSLSQKKMKTGDAAIKPHHNGHLKRLHSCRLVYLRHDTVIKPLIVLPVARIRKFKDKRFPRPHWTGFCQLDKTISSTSVRTDHLTSV